MQGRKLIRRSTGLFAAVVLATAGALVVVPTVTVGAADASANRPEGASFAAARVAEAHAGDSGTPDVTTAENPDVNAQAVITVTTTTDGGAGSLREAIETLAVNAGGDTVVLQAGATYTLTCAGGGDLDHGNTPLTIQGNGATLTMEAGCNEGILDNGSGALVIEDVNFSGVSISVAVNLYGALVDTIGEVLTLTRVTASGNSFTSTDDISVFNSDSGSSITTLTDVTVTDTTIDSATGGCGVFCTHGTMATRLSVDGTVYTGDGTCGIFCTTDVTLVDSQITNTTVTDSSGSGDCGIFCGGDFVMTGSTVADFTLTVTGLGGSCGVFCSDDVTMTNSSIMRSTMTAVNYVCGVFCSGDVTMTDSAVDATTMTATGPNSCGVVCGSEVIITNSSITRTRMTTDDNCGLIICSGDVTVTNSTIADNVGTATGESTGVFDARAVTFAYVTFVGNQSAGQPAIDDVASFASFGSVLADSGPGGNCGNTFTVTSYGDNFADDTSCGFTGTGDTEGAGLDPLLAPLADNGGPGPTMLPQAASPLVDAIPAARCQTPPLATGITTDERSLPRPSALGPDCEIGAVELQPAPPVIEPTFTG